jgi:hypothetical protein
MFGFSVDCELQRSAHANEHAQSSQMMPQRDAVGFALGGFGSGERTQPRSRLRLQSFHSTNRVRSSLLVRSPLLRQHIQRHMESSVCFLRHKFEKRTQTLCVLLCLPPIVQVIMRWYQDFLLKI